MSLLRALFLSITVLFTSALPASAQDEAALRAEIARLSDANFETVRSVVEALEASGDPSAAPVLRALRGGDLFWHEENFGVFRAEKAPKRSLTLLDPLTGAEIETVKKRIVSKIKVNNSLRSRIDAALAGLTLRSPDPAVRITAAEQLFDDRDPAALPALRAAAEAETDAKVQATFQTAIAAIVATDTNADDTARIDAVSALQLRGDRAALNVLKFVEPDAPSALRTATDGAIEVIEARLKLWGYAQNVWQGLSLGSVLLLAAIGLAITFGVMGVINMAHGELVMLGAYTTFAAQEAIRAYAPGMFDASLLIAAPLAFLVVGAVGICIERGCVRFLYGRPLETLLATWGISLILQQAVRTIFGPNNREVGNPSWMSGAFELGELTITYNRLWIFLFALAVFATLLMVLKRTPLGLQMRAVTQNRAMAADMGIRTGRVDALTFGLGAGVAGLAGVALSQLDNVSPNLGQGYIVDSFMVVVFGGAGNLWGALAGAFSLGIANKFLEPFSGAVLAKILVLIFIILFIQWRPRGLFALKGRAVDS